MSLPVSICFDLECHYFFYKIICGLRADYAQRYGQEQHGGTIHETFLVYFVIKCLSSTRILRGDASDSCHYRYVLEKHLQIGNCRWPQTLLRTWANHFRCKKTTSGQIMGYIYFIFYCLSALLVGIQLNQMVSCYSSTRCTWCHLLNFEGRLDIS